MKHADYVSITELGYVRHNQKQATEKINSILVDDQYFLCYLEVNTAYRTSQFLLINATETKVISNNGRVLDISVDGGKLAGTGRFFHVNGKHSDK